MKTHKNTSDIEFDGARVLRANRDGSNISITLKIKGAVVNIEFISVTEEKAELYKGERKVLVNEHFPPLDTIETFNIKDSIYQFSGYINNDPWSVWSFKAGSYVITCQQTTANK